MSETTSNTSESETEEQLTQAGENTVADDQQSNQVREILVPEVFPVMDKLSPPTPMQLIGNLADNWKRFKQRFNIYLAASGAGGNDEKLKASIFLHVIGEDALDIYNSFQLDEANLTLNVLMAKFEDYQARTSRNTF